MLRHIVTSPFQNITDRPTSHRSAQAYIYAEMIRESHPGDEVVINVGGKIKDLHRYDVVWVYHGNDFQGGLNLYGGLEGFDGTNILAISKLGSKVPMSLGIPFPDYGELIKGRLAKAKNPRPEWSKIDFEALNTYCSYPEIVSPNFEMQNIEGVILGDSHATSLYRPGYLLNSMPFKTLYGMVKGDRFQACFDATRCGRHVENLDLYFGNIDIRHHLCRQPDPHHATRMLVADYFAAAEKIDCERVTIYEPLPIENESRKLPKTGYYKGTPFFGSWEDRNEVRTSFIIAATCLQTEKVRFLCWTDYLKNNRGELDFAHMEKPQSVHLARSSYPFWTGIDNTISQNGFEEFA